MVLGRGNVENSILDTLRQILNRLDVEKISQRREAHVNDGSDVKAMSNSLPKDPWNKDK